MLLAMLAVRRFQSRVELIALVFGTGAALAALALVAMWIVPPWWTPIVFLVIYAVFAIVRLARLPRIPDTLPGSISGWVGTALFLALGIWSGTMLADAYRGRQAPPETVDLSFPLAAGTYLIVNGGATATVNAHFLTLNPVTVRQRAYHGQSFAVDLVEVDNFGFRADRWRPRDPARYAIFGDPVLSPCSGDVLRTEDDRRDMPVPLTDQEMIEGNHVVLQCGEVGVLLAHLQRGSILVNKGDLVTVGQPLGSVGNSGQTGEPHLHVHAQRMPKSGPLLSGQPLHLTFDGRFPVRGQRFVIE
jgi:hypothetical protein